jgi:predicted RNase H-like nuclease
LKAAEKLSGNGVVDLIIIDMPVSTEEITGRRSADDAISKAFGGKGCSTHTPNVNRPGLAGRAISTGFRNLGYRIATASTQISATKHLVETYPHPALLTLLAAQYRIPYKVSKSTRYWRNTPVPQRIDNLLKEFRRILDALKNKMSNILLTLPADGEVCQLSQLKRYEEALDALVCAWVGIECLQGGVRPCGDEAAAIWVP